ncbi:MAG TPA: hypothetical protein VGM90_07085 [Kofleriaceae bacterium]
MNYALAALLLTALPACFHPSYDHPACGSEGQCPDDLTCVAGLCESAASPDDAAPDAEPDAAPDVLVDTCIGTVDGLLRVCPTGEVAASVVKSSISTDLLSMDCDASLSSSMICVVVGTNVMVNVPMVTGSRALVIAAYEQITVTTLGVMSNDLRGPGAPFATCPTPNGTPNNGIASSGGGAGASFGGKGGAGGRPDMVGMGVASPAVIDPATLTTLRAGCDGGKGGQFNGQTPGTGGFGGGAVYLVANGSIQIMTSINASGSGGHAMPSRGVGGAGGGSGGFIGLDAPVINAMGAQIFANGGGGGGGGGKTTGAYGGQGGAPSTATVAAMGGNAGDIDAGDGGHGSVGIAAGQDGFQSNNSGSGSGGGGGGAGVIRVWRSPTLNAAVVSPPAVLP